VGGIHAQLDVSTKHHNVDDSLGAGVFAGPSISKMQNGSEVITQRLSYSEQPHRFFPKLPKCLEQAECTPMRISGAGKYFQVLLNTPEVAKQNTRIFQRVWSRLQHAIKSYLQVVKISELLQLPHWSPWPFQCTWSQTLWEWKYIMSILNSTMR